MSLEAEVGLKVGVDDDVASFERRLATDQRRREKKDVACRRRLRRSSRLRPEHPVREIGVPPSAHRNF